MGTEGLTGEPGPLTRPQVDAYLARIGAERPAKPTLEALTTLQLAHLQSAPFENLAVFCRRPVTTDNDWTFHKVVEQQRGGWCFELNGAFAQLLESLGYGVRRLGAAVLLTGPATLIDHLVLEVRVDQPYLVEVGFGEKAPIVPLPLQQPGPIATRSGTWEFLSSPQGTTLAQIVNGVPEARYRFKRVSHQPHEFATASDRLQTDRTLHWSTTAFATRLLDDQGTRRTLTRAKIKTTRLDEVDPIDERPVDPNEWNQVLFDEFGIVEQVPPEALRRRPN